MSNNGHKKSHARPVKLNAEDLKICDYLQERLGVARVDVVRIALRRLYERMKADNEQPSPLK